MTGIYRNLLYSAVGLTTDWLKRDDASRNAIFGQIGGRLKNVAGTDIITADLLYPQGFTALDDGFMCVLTPASNNTGPATLNIEGTGAVAIRDGAGVALAADVLVAGRAVLLGYDADAGYFRILFTNPASVIPLGLQLVTATGTYVPTSGTQYIILLGQAAGGGGGDAISNTGRGDTAGETRFGAFPCSTTQAVVIGDPGVGGAAGGSPNETAAQDSSFGSLMTCKGGKVGISGDKVPDTGSGGIRIEPTGKPTFAVEQGLARGGSCILGQSRSTISNGGGIGQAGDGFGSGGCPASFTSGVAAGGDGAPGCFIVLEFGLV